MDIDIAAVAARFREEDLRIREARARRHAEARRQLGAAVDVAKGFPEVTRIRVSGSVVRPDRFTEMSDIDLCIEGVASPETWLRLERALLDVVEVPLDLVRWESLIEPHRESITARGEVVYDSGE